MKKTRRKATIYDNTKGGGISRPSTVSLVLGGRWWAEASARETAKASLSPPRSWAIRRTCARGVAAQSLGAGE